MSKYIEKEYLFIYKKDTEIIALTYTEAINQVFQLENDKWTLIHTLDVISWLKYHINTNKAETLIKLLTD